MNAILLLIALNSNGATGSSNAASSSGTGSRPPSRCVQINATRLPSDELLGFDAAVTALGLKANISEAQHPLICEGTRRQKGDLAIALLVQYKDDQYKLDKVCVIQISSIRGHHKTLYSNLDYPPSIGCNRLLVQAPCIWHIH